MYLYLRVVKLRGVDGKLVRINCCPTMVASTKGSHINELPYRDKRKGGLTGGQHRCVSDPASVLVIERTGAGRLRNSGGTGNKLIYSPYWVLPQKSRASGHGFSVFTASRNRRHLARFQSDAGRESAVRRATPIRPSIGRIANGPRTLETRTGRWRRPACPWLRPVCHR